MSDPTAPSRPSHHAPPVPVADEVTALGDRLGVWRVTAALFEVGSGHWFRVTHALTGEDALAMVYRHASDAEAVLMRFAEDSDTLARLNLPAYGAPLDCGLSPSGRPYLVVPAMEGAPLMRVAMALPLRRRLELLLALVAMLDAAQARGLVLHELDPGMLWLGPHQQLCWLGQGLAPRLSQAPPALVRAAEPLADPRQCGGARPDSRSEAHAVGRLMGLLINGRLPGREGGAGARADATAAEVAATPVASLQSWLALSAAQRDSLELLLNQAMTDGQSFPDRATLGQAVQDWLNASAPSAPAPAARLGDAQSATTPTVAAATAAAAGRASAPMPLPLSAQPPLKPPGATLAERIAAAAAVLAVAALVLWLLLRMR